MSTGIKNMLTADDYDSFIHKQIDRSKQITKNIKERQLRKINTLKEKYFKLYGFVFNHDWVENKTTLEIPIECLWMLSLGKKLSLPVDKRNFSPLHIIADVEQCIQSMDDNVDKCKDIARTKLANRVANFKRNREKFILTIYEKTKKFLRKNENITIIQADKGNKTVVMYKKDYEDKMESLLEDKTTYRATRTDPTVKLQKDNNTIVLDLYKQNIIDLR